MSAHNVVMTSLDANARPLGRAIGCWTAELCIGLLSALAFPAFAQPASNICGELGNAYGPYDYRSDRDKLPIVEGAHFTPEVEALIRGKSSYIGSDLDYTLRAFPNHHRALLSMMKLAERAKNPQPQGARYTIECWFDRAVRFKPDDTIARMFFATYLHKIGREAEASQQVDRAVAVAGDNAFTHHNAGLVYLELKNYDKALQEAHVAYALGFPRPALRDALKAAGKWVEPLAVRDQLKSVGRWTDPMSEPAPAASGPAATPAASPSASEPGATAEPERPLVGPTSTANIAP